MFLEKYLKHLLMDILGDHIMNIKNTINSYSI